MSADAVLTAAADEIERWPDYKTRREFKGGAGGAVYVELFEQAQRLYGWTAIQHLQRHLGINQLQHWREGDRTKVVEALRAAAQQPPAVDLETETLRVRLTEFHMALAEAMGWLTYNVTTLVRETGSEMARLRRENERLKRELDEARRSRQP